MRILLMGLPGSDTGALAAKYSQTYGIPVMRMDDLCLLQDGSKRSLSHVQSVLRPFLKGKGWVLEGNYPALELDARLDACDLAVLLNPPSSRLRKSQGIKLWFRQRKARKRMKVMFRALAAREDPKIYTICSVSEAPFPAE